MALSAEFERLALHAKLATQAEAASDDNVRAVLVPGWDVTHAPWSVDAPNIGVWRAPHLNILHSVEPTEGPRPILQCSMRPDQIAAGLWRQLRILPDEGGWRLARLDAAPCRADDTVLDPFAPDVSVSMEGTNDVFIRSLLGHSVCDAADYLYDLGRRHPEAGRIVMAKDLKRAIREYPWLKVDDWPGSCRKRWSKQRGRDFLPPIYFLSALYETARLAQNHAALLSLSFTDEGQEIMLAAFRKELEGIEQEEPSLVTQRLINLSRIQSVSLLALGQHGQRRPGILGCTSVSELAMALFERAETFLHTSDEFSAGFSEAQAERWLRHPDIQKIQREGRGASMPKRLAVTYRGLTWRQHAAVGLLQIAEQARAWNREFRPEGPKLTRRRNSGIGLSFSEDQSAAAITYLWLQTFDRAALSTGLAPVLGAKEKAAARHGVPFEQDQSIAERAEQSQFGYTVCEQARSLLPHLPSAGRQGWTAWYHPALWISSHGDDINHYLNWQMEFVQGKERASRRGKPAPWARGRTSRIEESVAKAVAQNRGLSSALNGQARATLDTDSPDEPYVAQAAQNSAMTVFTLGIDPIHSALIKKAQRAASQHRT